MTLTRIKDRPVNTLVIISTSQPSVWVDQSGTQQRWRFPYLFRLPFLWWLYSHLWQVKSSFADQSTFLYWKLSSSLSVCLFFFLHRCHTWTWGIVDAEEFQRRLPTLGKPNAGHVKECKPGKPWIRKGDHNFRSTRLQDEQRDVWENVLLLPGRALLAGVWSCTKIADFDAG